MSARFSRRSLVPFTVFNITMTLPKTWRHKISPDMSVLLGVTLVGRGIHTVFFRPLGVFEPGGLLGDIKKVTDHRKWSRSRRVGVSASSSIAADDQECDEGGYDSKKINS